MKWLLICCIWLLVCDACYGQRYRYNEITAQADSILSFKLGSTLFQYCTVDRAGSYYSYRKKKQERFRKLNKPKTKRHFLETAVHYKFKMPYPKCPCMDTIRGEITVKLDTALHLAEDMDTAFIPGFVFADDSCHFISKQEAITIAMHQPLHLSVAEPYAYLHPTPRNDGFVWIVLRTIWNEKDVANYTTTKDDMVVIDALTGEVRENKMVPYAPHVYQ